MRIGSLFTGAGGLDWAVEAVFGGTVVWHCEVDPAASKVLAHHYPEVPNLGDITAVDWDQVEPVDVLCGGFPCQDVSAAGLRAGLRHGNRSGLWAVFAEAISVLRPKVVVIENVRGLLSAKAHRDMEPGDGVMGEGGGNVVLRAAGAVLGDLSEAGYDAQWCTVPASAVGAPHRRERVFVVAADTVGGEWEGERFAGGDGAAYPAVGGDQQFVADAGDDGRRRCPQLDTQGSRSSCGCDVDGCDVGVGGSDGQAGNGGGVDAVSVAEGVGRDEGGTEYARLERRPDAAVGGDEARRLDLLPTPVRSDYKGGHMERVSWENTTKSRGEGGASSLADVACLLLPTPMANQSHNTPENHLRKKPGRKVVTDLAIVVENGLLESGGELLPTPQAGEPLLGGQAKEMATDWGKYGPAIRRWEQVTRPAPAPTEPNKNGNPRLAAAFSEWMLGWPAGWVSDVDGLTRNDMLRIIGNGVCAQQCFAALQYLIQFIEVDP